MALIDLGTNQINFDNTFETYLPFAVASGLRYFPRFAIAPISQILDGGYLLAVYNIIVGAGRFEFSEPIKIFPKGDTIYGQLDVPTPIPGSPQVELKVRGVTYSGFSIPDPVDLQIVVDDAFTQNL